MTESGQLNNGTLDKINDAASLLGIYVLPISYKSKLFWKHVNIEEFYCYIKKCLTCIRETIDPENT